MKHKLWILRVVGCVEPEIYGPYRSEKARIAAAKKLNDDGENIIIRVNSCESPCIYPFVNSEINN